MKATARSKKCIACADTKAQPARIGFMSYELEYAICRACAPYVQRVVSDHSFSPDYMRFLGVAKMSHSNQSGGAFSCVVPQEAAPDDLAARLSDFDTFCQFLGQRIRELKSHETED